ncbi:hypothetical protein KP1_03 [Klebsiella virus 2019KP1]|nr:hypothetical protein KP1_03 [Klebsiella virus 2019KP1]
MRDWRERCRPCVYAGIAGRGCTRCAECNFEGGGLSPGALAIKWWALCPAANEADAFDIPMRAIAQKWVYEGLGEYL